MTLATRFSMPGSSFQAAAPGNGSVAAGGVGKRRPSNPPFWWVSQPPDPAPSQSDMQHSQTAPSSNCTQSDGLPQGAILHAVWVVSESVSVCLRPHAHGDSLCMLCQLSGRNQNAAAENTCDNKKPLSTGRMLSVDCRRRVCRYAYDYGAVHFVMVSSEHDLHRHSVQYKVRHASLSGLSDAISNISKA